MRRAAVRVAGPVRARLHRGHEPKFGTVRGPIFFETQRLIVREYTPEDVSFVFDMYSREEVQRYLGRPLQTIEEASQRVERWRRHYSYDQLHGAWAVTIRDTGQIVGTVSLKRASLSADVPPPSGENPVGDLPLSDDYEVGWHLHPDQWGHGYATEASAGALRRAFDAGIPEVIALVDPDNVRSRLVADRLGMQYVGRTRRYESKELDLFLARPV